VDCSPNNPSAHANIQVCALKYRCPGAPIESAEGKTILLAVRDAKALRLFMHRSLKQLITDQDLEYIHELMKDLIDRARLSPENVFQQISHLSVGPVFTDFVEWANAELLESDSFKDEFSPYCESAESVDTLL
jgi:hypothetical protein